MANPKERIHGLEEVLADEASDFATSLDRTKNLSKIHANIELPTGDTLHPQNADQFVSWTKAANTLKEFSDKRKGQTPDAA